MSTYLNAPERILEKAINSTKVTQILSKLRLQNFQYDGGDNDCKPLTSRRLISYSCCEDSWDILCRATSKRLPTKFLLTTPNPLHIAKHIPRRHGCWRVRVCSAGSLAAGLPKLDRRHYVQRRSKRVKDSVKERKRLIATRGI